MNVVIPKISIIVPVYNTEQYLSKCIGSILNQECKDFELLLIDDGSPDNSGKICDNFALNDDRIRVFHIPNGGVSSARNLGLKESKGYYIWFIDSDDWIACDCLQVIVDTLDNDQLDVLQIGYYSVVEDKLIPCNQKFRQTTNILTSFDYMALNLFIGGSWSSIFKKKIAIDNNVVFDKDLKLAEDQLFFLSIMNYSKRVCRINELFYYYYSNPFSALHTSNGNDLLISIAKITDFEYYNIFKYYCDGLIIQQFLIYLNTLNNKFEILDGYMKKANIAKNTYLGYNVDSLKDKIVLFLYCFLGMRFLKLYCRIYSKKHYLKKIFHLNSLT